MAVISGSLKQFPWNFQMSETDHNKLNWSWQVLLLPYAAGHSIRKHHTVGSFCPNTFNNRQSSMPLSEGSTHGFRTKWNNHHPFYFNNILLIGIWIVLQKLVFHYISFCGSLACECWLWFRQVNHGVQRSNIPLSPVIWSFWVEGELVRKRGAE